MFYNTTGLNKKELANEVREAVNKNEQILVICKSMKRPFTPDEVLARFIETTGRKQSPSTVRRCITDFTSEGILEKTEQTAKSDMGKTMHKWKVKEWTDTFAGFINSL